MTPAPLHAVSSGVASARELLKVGETSSSGSGFHSQSLGYACASIDDTQQVQYARSIGIDPDGEPELLACVQPMLAIPLPQPWRECVDPKNRIYFHNPRTRAVTWTHPQTEKHAALAAALRRVLHAPDRLTKAFTELEEIRNRIQVEIENWREVRTEGSKSYYYHVRTHESCWENPRQALSMELAQQAQMLAMLLQAQADEEADVQPMQRLAQKTLQGPPLLLTEQVGNASLALLSPEEVLAARTAIASGQLGPSSAPRARKQKRLKSVTQLDQWARLKSSVIMLQRLYRQRRRSLDEPPMLGDGPAPVAAPQAVEPIVEETLAQAEGAEDAGEGPAAEPGEPMLEEEETPPEGTAVAQGGGPAQPEEDQEEALRRRRRARELEMQTRFAVLWVQRFWRQRQARKKEEQERKEAEERLELEKALLEKGRLKRQENYQKKFAVVWIQRHWRQLRAKRLEALRIRQEGLAESFQAMARTVLAQRELARRKREREERKEARRREKELDMKRRFAVFFVQRKWRERRERKLQELLVKKVELAISFQTVARTVLAQQELAVRRREKEELQEARRCEKELEMRKKFAVFFVQRHWRKRRERKLQELHLRQEHLAVTFQAIARTAIARAGLQQQQELTEAAALKLQSFERGRQSRRLAAQLRQQEADRSDAAAVVLQSRFRGFLARKERERLREEQRQRELGAVAVQRMWRGYAARKNVAEERAEARRRLLAGEEGNIRVALSGGAVDASLGVQGRSLGVIIDVATCKVTRIEPSAVLAMWNAQHPHYVVRSGDELLAIDGESNAAGMVARLCSASPIHELVLRSQDGLVKPPPKPEEEFSLGANQLMTSSETSRSERRTSPASNASETQGRLQAVRNQEDKEAGTSLEAAANFIQGLSEANAGFDSLLKAARSTSGVISPVLSPVSNKSSGSVMQQEVSPTSSVGKRSPMPRPGVPARVQSPPPKLDSEASSPNNGAADRGDPNEFSITIHKTQGQGLGVLLNPQDDGTLLVKAIRDGAVSAWNAQNPDLQVKPGDQIVGVNDVSDDPRLMVDSMQQEKASQVRLRLRRRGGGSGGGDSAPPSEAGSSQHASPLRGGSKASLGKKLGRQKGMGRDDFKKAMAGHRAQQPQLGPIASRKAEQVINDAASDASDILASPPRVLPDVIAPRRGSPRGVYAMRPVPPPKNNRWQSEWKSSPQLPRPAGSPGIRPAPTGLPAAAAAKQVRAVDAVRPTQDHARGKPGFAAPLSRAGAAVLAPARSSPALARR